MSADKWQKDYLLSINQSYNREAEVKHELQAWKILEKAALEVDSV